MRLVPPPLMLMSFKRVNMLFSTTGAQWRLHSYMSSLGRRTRHLHCGNQYRKRPKRSHDYQSFHGWTSRERHRILSYHFFPPSFACTSLLLRVVPVDPSITQTLSLQLKYSEGRNIYQIICTKITSYLSSKKKKESSR